MTGFTGVLAKKKIERDTANTIVLRPGPIQWLMIHISDVMMIIRWNINIICDVLTQIRYIFYINKSWHSSFYA